MDFTVTPWAGTSDELLAYLDGLAVAPPSKQRTCFTDWHEWRNYIIYSLDTQGRQYRIPPKLFIARRGDTFAGLLIMTSALYNPPDTFYISFVCSTIKGAAEALISHVKSIPEVNVLKLSSIMGTQRFYVNQGFRFQTYIDDPMFRRGEPQDMEMIWKKESGYVADTEGGRRKRRRKTRRRHK